MHHSTDRIAHTTAFVTPVVEHWLEREIAQWVHAIKDRSDDPSHHERTLLPRSYISLLRRIEIAGNEAIIPPVLIGDTAYPICSRLHKHYENREAPTEDKTYFNYRLSTAHKTIENTFGRFKGWWK